MLRKMSLLGHAHFHLNSLSGCDLLVFYLSLGVPFTFGGGPARHKDPAGYDTLDNDLL